MALLTSRVILSRLYSMSRHYRLMIPQMITKMQLMPYLFNMVYPLIPRIGMNIRLDMERLLQLLLQLPFLVIKMLKEKLQDRALVYVIIRQERSLMKWDTY